MNTNSAAMPFLTQTNENIGYKTITASSYTIKNEDLGMTLIMNSASAQTLTIPVGLSKGFNVSVLKINTGALTVAAGSGVTLNTPNVSNVFTTRYGSFQIINYASQTFVITPSALPSFGSAVASAAAIAPTGKVFHVTGTTNITSITSTGIPDGQVITIIFDGILTFTDGSNLKLAGNMTTSADDTITLVYDLTNDVFYEMCRSVN